MAIYDNDGNIIGNPVNLPSVGGKFVNPAAVRQLADAHNDLYGNVRQFENILGSVLESEGIDQVRGRWSFDTRMLSLDAKEGLSRGLMQSLGLDQEMLARAQNVGEGQRVGGFQLTRPIENMRTRGFGNFVAGSDAFAGDLDTDTIFNRLFYTTSNVQFRQGGSQAIMMPRYKADFLMEQAENIQQMKTQGSRGFFSNISAFVIDTETAGLNMDSGIWQLSGRSMAGAEVATAANEIPGRAANGLTFEMVIDNKNMSRGFQEVDVNGQQQMRSFRDMLEDISQTGRVDPDIVSGMSRMKSDILGSTHIIGQNLSFDMPRISYDIRKALTSGKYDKRTVDSMNEILGHLENKVKVIDTQVLSQAIFQGAGEEAIRPATELTKVGKYTKYSIENIMLQTNFLDLLADDLTFDGQSGWKIIEGMLDPANMGKGAHNAMVDTFLTGHLARIQAQHLAGERALIAKKLGRGWGRNRRKRVRGWITRSSAWTPYTKDVDTGLRGIETMIEHTRGTGVLGKLNKTDVFFNAGMLSQWADEMTARTGTIQDFEALEGFRDKVGGRALRHGLPVGALSPFEALINIQLARTGEGMGPRSIPGLVGDVMGSASALRTEGIGMKGKRNIGMNLEFIRWAEERGIIPSQATGDFRSARWSTVRGRHKRGLSLVVDPFENEEQVRQFRTQFLDEIANASDDDFAARFGVDRETARDTIRNMDEALTLEYGVQVGFLEEDGTGRVTKALNLLEAEELGLDAEDTMRLRTHVYELEGQEGRLFTGTSFVDTPNTDQAKMLEASRRTREITAAAYNELARDRVRKTSIELGKHRGANRVQQIDNILRKTMTKKTGLAAVAGGLGYYLYNRRQEQAPYDEAMEFGGWDTSISPKSSPLGTAGLVQGLDDQKIGHTRMGPDKDAHLFAV